MLNRRDSNFGQGQLWMPFWPEDPYDLGPELGPMAEILGQPELLEPFIASYERAARETGLCLTGRKTIPIRTFAGMMVLKHMSGLSYRDLCAQVKDRMSRRVFCRIPFGKKVPDYSTLCKLGQRFGPQAIEEMNRALLKRLDGQNKLKARRSRLTPRWLNIEHPTDAKVLKQGIAKIGRLVERCREAGITAAGDFVNHWRTVRRHLLGMAKVARRRTGEATREIDRITARLAVIAENTLEKAKRILKAAKIGLAKGCAKLKGHVVAELAETCLFLEKAIAQAWQVASGDRHIKDRLVSIHDPGARPIRKGKPHKPTEFGRKVLLASNEQHLVTGYRVLKGNPSDDSLFAAAVEQYKANTGYIPKEAAGDRGVASAENELIAAKFGIERVSLPKRGKKSPSRRAYEKQPWFRRLQRMRAGQEAEISVLKRRFGLARSLSRGDEGTTAWVGWSVLAYNLCVAARL